MSPESQSEAMRVEHDSMGEVLVPESAKWGAQTQRAVENFPISPHRMPRSMIRALALIKGAAAEVNASLGVINEAEATALRHAADRVANGEFDGHFPVDVFQTGSGTSTNMNVNEVLANLASDELGRRLSPNDVPNASQSSNDVFPSAMHLALTFEIVHTLIPSLGILASSLGRKASEFSTVVKSGRTHLMDATPVTLGQEFSGYAAAITYGIERLNAVLPRVGELPLGGTAVGTGLNAPPGFASSVIDKLAGRLHLPLREARNHFEAQGARDGIVEASGALRTIAVSLFKIANDLRLMSSGPMCGLGEIALPDLQPGSSIMPGKVNPVVPEAVCQVAAQVIGNDSTVAFAGSAGTLELNVMLPVMAVNVLDSVTLLSNVSRAFAEKCIDNIVANVERCEQYALSSPSVGTSLNPYIGYEAAARIIKRSIKEGRDLKSLVVEEGLLSEDEASKALDVMAMTRGGVVR
ncbi:MAG: class II fumarate hydratase [Acidimicrobiales bacterium]